MTNLFVGGEDIEFGLVSAVVNTADPGARFDPTYARCSLKPTADVGIIHDFKDDLSAYIAINNGMQYGYRWRGGGGGFTFGSNIICFYRNFIPFFQVRQRGAAGQMGATTYDNTGSATDYAGSVIAQSASHTEQVFEIKIGNPGYIRWWIGGVLWWSFTGNTDALGATASGTLLNRAIWGNGNSNGDSDFSEIMVTSLDDSRLGKRLNTLYATADGFNTAWNGGFGDIDEITENTADSINTPTNGAKETHIYTDPAALGVGVGIQDIVISTKMQSQVGSPQHAKGLIRLAGTDYESPMQSVPNTPNNNQFYFRQSPATSAPWTTTEASNAEYGLTAVT